MPEDKGKEFTFPQPVTDPKTGLALEPRDQPGYYPGYSTMGQQKYWDEHTRKVVGERATRQDKPIRFFTPDEARTMQAVIDRVLPQDDRTPERRIPILPSVDERLYLNKLEGYRYEDMPPDREAYKIAVHAFDKMAKELHGKRFDEVRVIEQERILQSLHDGEPLAAKDEWKKMNLHRFWSQLVSDVCSVYYAHPWSWDEIGFGGPAYPRAYMRLENGKPEPWEVNERRYEWAAPADTLSGDEDLQGEREQEQSHHGQGGTH